MKNIINEDGQLTKRYSEKFINLLTEHGFIIEKKVASNLFIEYSINKENVKIWIGSYYNETEQSFLTESEILKRLKEVA